MCRFFFYKINYLVILCFDKNKLYQNLILQIAKVLDIMLGRWLISHHYMEEI